MSVKNTIIFEKGLSAEIYLEICHPGTIILYKNIQYTFLIQFNYVINYIDAG